MDDFRVDSVSPCDVSGGQKPSDAANRRKSRRPRFPLAEQGDDVVTLSEQEDDTTEVLEDTYCPSEREAPPE